MFSLDLVQFCFLVNRPFFWPDPRNLSLLCYMITCQDNGNTGQLKQLKLFADTAVLTEWGSREGNENWKRKPSIVGNYYHLYILLSILMFYFHFLSSIFFSISLKFLDALSFTASWLYNGRTDFLFIHNENCSIIHRNTKIRFSR